MPSIFLDASALVRRYDRAEPGSATIQAICAESNGHDLIVSRLVTVEVASAFGRKGREGTYNAKTVAGYWRVFQAHVRDQYRVIEASESIYDRAEQLVFTHPLRAADAVHIASALEIAVAVPEALIQFWTADRRQAEAASAEGLDVRLVR